MALDDRHGSGGHPDAEQLAEYADGVMPAADRAGIERHLADCEDCRAVLTETMAFMATEQGAMAPAAQPRVVPFRRPRWVTSVAAGLAVAATLVLAIRTVRPAWLGFGPGVDRPELQELVAALANEPTRPVEGRLTGAFAYGPAPSPTRGVGDRELSPEVRIAAANIEKIDQRRNTPDTRAALAVAQLVLGNVDLATSLLENLSLDRSDNSAVLSDLAASYLARASRLGRSADVPKALAAADRALKIDPQSLPALFNRAIALEELRLRDQAHEAWLDYLKHDAVGPWADEATRRARALKTQSRADIWQAVTVRLLAAADGEEVNARCERSFRPSSQT